MVPVSQRKESFLRANGIRYIAGIDEAGRGPLAGPVVAAAVILPHKTIIRGLDDSKKLSPKKREKLYIEIQKKAVSIGVGIVSEKVIDRINILQATLRAMHEAVERLSITPEHILVDGDKKIPSLSLNQTAIPKGDSKCSSIAAASIIAKVTRDRIMVKLDAEYPGFGFAIHKGYGTKAHKKALRKYGRSPIHRLSFTC
ncbi:MAG: ribonuclease HII [Candidatus Saganbacteria bacterium]|nr:ribonuclease HII [Candidatus Saganbacteria bacterium]